MKSIRYFAAFTFFALIASGWSSSALAQRPSANVSVLAMGLNNPRGLLVVPTGLTFGPDGALYISNVGYGAPPVGAGQILNVQIID